MRRKDIGFILALALLIYMAVASEKKILVAEGHAVSQEVIEVGRSVYDEYCHSCHGSGHNGAPRIGDEEVWKMRLRKGINPVIAHTIVDHRQQRYIPPESSTLDNESIASAVAYLVQTSGKSRFRSAFR
jgi:cytochrome c5